MKRATLLAIVLAASSVHADVRGNVWERATDGGKPETAADEKYESEMRQGDEHAMLANVGTASLSEVKRQIQNALTAYRAAAATKPDKGEPYYRIGKLIYSFYFDCTAPGASQRAPITCDTTRRVSQFSRERANEVIAAWDAFEAREPLDPRLSVNAGGSEILFDRAILNTRLAADPKTKKKHLQAAAQDYEKLIARADGDAASSVLGNLAETYMMLGRMEDALDTYRAALRGGTDTATFYGYAVALDRDESAGQALDIIRALGPEQRGLFYAGVQHGGTFFVPEGEMFYYFALADEAFGFDDEAIDNWNRFIASGAHAEYAPRAKAHRDALLAKKRRKAFPIEAPWRMFR